MPSSHLLLCRPLLLLLPISLNIRVFSNESNLHMRLPKYCSFSFSIIPSKEIPGLIFFRIILVGSPCSPRDSQESSPTAQFKASILWRSGFFTVQLSHPYMTTGKTALTRRNSYIPVSKSSLEKSNDSTERVTPGTSPTTFILRQY